MALTSDELDAAVLRRCFWPATNAPITQAERLAIASEEIVGLLFPRVVKAHAAYYLTTVDTPLAAGVEKYRGPARAYGSLASIKIVDTAGAEHDLGYFDAADLARWGTSQGVPAAFYLDGDFIGLRPVPSNADYTLRVRYTRKPNALCLLADARTIASAPSGSAYEVDTAPPGAWSTGTQYLDVIAAGEAGNVLDGRAPVSGIAGTTITLGRAVAPYVAVGDYVALAELAPLVQLPSYLHTAAIRYIAAACLHAHGDREAAGVEFATAQALAETAFATGVPRVSSEPRPLTTPNSPFRMRRR